MHLLSLKQRYRAQTLLQEMWQRRMPQKTRHHAPSRIHRGRARCGGCRRRERGRAAPLPPAPYRGPRPAWRRAPAQENGAFSERRPDYSSQKAPAALLPCGAGSLPRAPPALTQPPVPRLPGCGAGDAPPVPPRGVGARLPASPPGCGSVRLCCWSSAWPTAASSCLPASLRFTWVCSPVGMGCGAGTLVFRCRL